MSAKIGILLVAIFGCLSVAWSIGVTLSSAALVDRTCEVNGETVFCSHNEAITRLHQDLFGDDETHDVWSISQIAPTKSDIENGMIPVSVGIQLFVEKIKVDSREQEASLKFWLRTRWDDHRLAWTPADYAYRDWRNGALSTSEVRAISRTTGFWKPDLVLYEAHEHFQSMSFGQPDFPAEIQSSGYVYLAQAQQVTLHFAPEMNMQSFPFDEEIIQFSIGPWTHTEDHIKMEFFETGFLRLPGFDCFFTVPEPNSEDPNQWGDPAPCQIDDSLVFSEANSSSTDHRKFALSEEWGLTGYNQLRVYKVYWDTVSSLAFTEMQGRIHLRRYSEFYMNFIIIPNIFLTMIGFAAHSFRGHTAGSVTFIAGTGFTVALALVAQNLFLVEVIPVITSYSFLEFQFVFSFGLSLIATTTSLYLYKQTEGREENAQHTVLEERTWVTMSDEEKSLMKSTLILEVCIFPSFGLAYTLGVVGTAASFGANGSEVAGMLAYLVIGFLILCVAAALDCWRSADMQYAPNRPLKRHLRLYLRGSRLYRRLWHTTEDRKTQERREFFVSDEEISGLNKELMARRQEVTARIEKKTFFRNDPRDIKEEERARLMAEIDRLDRLAEQHGLTHTPSGNIASPRPDLSNHHGPAPPPQIFEGGQGGAAVHGELAQVSVAGHNFGVPGSGMLSCEPATLGVGQSSASAWSRDVEQLLVEWELEDAGPALRAFGVTTERRLRELLRDEHVQELGLPPVTQLAVLDMMRRLRGQA